MHGRIIFLNGTSSAGKSSIARELLQVLRRTWRGFHRPVTATAEDCARRIGAFLPRRPLPTAFEKLRARLRPDLRAVVR
ncbi:hypothetical protein DKG34_16710 [Streptomyces sp. NWU49]|nr:hypothetical protein [Streptomyces sp. NWU49]PWJ06511.1 hypothetical protein DKG34_16710 [Streptomyces sp. NWU49]